MRELTPLDRLSDLDAALRKRLADFWITSVEELVSTARSSNQQYQSGRAALTVALGIGEDRVRALIDAALPLLPANVSFSVPVELEVGDGLFLDSYRDVDGASFGPPVNLPEQVEPLAPLPRAAFQGVRNSCVAFTLAAIYQTLSKDPTDLSEQFFYWLCKSRDKIPGDVGTDPLLAMRLLQEVGICTEATWPYKPAPSDQTNPGHEPPPEPAFTEAKTRRIRRFQQLPAKDFRQIQAALAAGRSVLIGLPIWEHWQGAWQGQALGRLRAPLPGERRKGGHAMAVVGYRNDATAPGGGYFIVRNSWGTDWAKDNPDGPGYCHVPYRLVFEQGLAAIAAEGVEVAAKQPPAAPAAKPTTRKPAPRSRMLGGAAVSLESVQAEVQATRAEIQRELRALREQLAAAAGRPPAADGDQGQTSAAGGGTMTSPEPTPEALKAIYEEAKQLRAQLESLIARLQPLVEPAAASSPAHAGAAPQPEVSPGAGAPRAAAAPAALPKNAVLGPLVLVAGGEDGHQLLHPLGVSPEGRPLLEIDAKAASAFARDTFSAESKEQIALYRTKRQSRVAHLGVVEGISAAALEQSRWAVVINALEDAALIKALWPLIEHRMRQMQLTPPAVSFKDGENAGAWLNRHTDGGKQTLKDHWGQIPPVLLYRPDERAGQWLARHGVAQGPVDPRRGVPYYLLVAGRPGPLHDDDQAHIPMNFQYLLDIFWGVGRLCFTDDGGKHRLADYTAYAQQLISFEQAQDAQERIAKEVVYFSTKHEADIATMRSTDELVLPLTRWHESPANVPAKQGFTMRSFVEAQATKENLGKVLNVGGTGKPPAVLFTAGHGLGLPLSDARLPLKQGALVTQDWSGVGPVRDTHWFAGDDLGTAKVGGMFAFLFACYGAGCPDYDEFIFDPALGAAEGRPRIAPFALIAQLPQRLLVNGALGVIGHVERAWTYSFTGTEDVKGQSQPFEDVLGRLLNGRRAGDATDQFNVIQGDRAMTLTEELENIKFGKQVDDFELAKLWMARNDARNYALLGDPAARLPFQA